MISAKENEDLLDARDYILRELGDEMKRRAKNPNWIIDERRAVVLAANGWATRHHMPARLTVADVERIETSAVGHIDYATKLALYVAEALYGYAPFSR